MQHVPADTAGPPRAASPVSVRRAAVLGAAHGLAFGLVAGLVIVALYLAGSGVTGSRPDYLLTLVPSGLLYVVAPVAALGAGVGALTGGLSCRRPSRAPLIGAGVAAAVTVLVAIPLSIAGLVVFVLGGGLVGILMAAAAGALLARRLVHPADRASGVRSRTAG